MRTLAHGFPTAGQARTWRGVPSAAGSEQLAALPGVERRVLPDLRHETLNEPEGPEVVAVIIDWLRTHTASGTPA